MIPDHLIQKAIISKLQASSLSLISNLSGNIKEDQIQTDTFGFPAIRVDLSDQSPMGNAVGRTKLSRVLFTIIVYSERPNSVQVNQIADGIINTLFDSQIFGTQEDDTP